MIDLNSISHFIKDNQLIAGGALVTVAGFVSGKIRAIPTQMMGFIRRESFITLHVYDSDDTFRWVKSWISKNFKARRDFMSYSDWRLDPTQTKITPFAIIPAPGAHFGWYKKTPIWVSYSQEFKSNAESGTYSLRNYVITFLSRKPEIALEFLTDCRDVHDPNNDYEIDLYKSDRSGGWMSNSITPRGIDSVILPEQEKESLVNDIKQFLSKKDWYNSMGIPHHRGYLIYGKPGNGKSSLISAIAGEFEMDIYSLSLSTVTDSNLPSLFYNMKQNSILLMEDVDCAFEERKAEDTKLTFSSLLNALDGVGARDGVIVMMTTNYVQKLDPALIRPGRVDYRLELRNASYEQAANLYKRFKPEAGDDEVIGFASQYGSGEYSMAQLQGLLIRGSLDYAVPSIPLCERQEGPHPCEVPQ